MSIFWSESTDRDADWIKTRSWDLPTDAKGFLNLIGENNVDSFMLLPAAEAMPEALKNELLAQGYSIVLKYAEGQPRDSRGRFASNSPFSTDYDGNSELDEKSMVEYALKEQGEYGSYLANNPEISKSITNYLSEGYYDVLNDKLRTGKDLSEEEQQDAENLFLSIMHEDAVFSTDATLWRGVQDNKGFFKELKVGQTFSDQGIISTSMNPVVAESFTMKYAGEGDGYMMKINLPKGMNALALESVLKGYEVFSPDDKEMYGFSMLNEVLLPSGTVFKVSSISGRQISLDVVAQDDIF